LLVLAPLTGGGRPNEIEVEDGVLNGFEKDCGFEQMPRTSRGGMSAFSMSTGAGPTLAGRYQTEIRQPEIGHRPRAHANVDRELRAHQDHCWAAAAAVLGMIRSGARHWRHISKSLTPGFEGVRRGVPASQKIEFAFLVILIIRENCGAWPSGSAP
jgi:hypothetical protein